MAVLGPSPPQAPLPRRRSRQSAPGVAAPPRVAPNEHAPPRVSRISTQGRYQTPHRKGRPSPAPAAPVSRPATPAPAPAAAGPPASWAAAAAAVSAAPTTASAALAAQCQLVSSNESAPAVNLWGRRNKLKQQNSRGQSKGPHVTGRGRHKARPHGTSVPQQIQARSTHAPLSTHRHHPTCAGRYCAPRRSSPPPSAAAPRPRRRRPLDVPYG
jgi:hypothetical protein